MIYLDNCSTTKPLDSVLNEIDFVARHEWGNPSSLHKFGLDAEKVITKCKKELASCIGCEPNEILITSCGTESTNTVLKGYFDAYPRKGKHIITSKGEHKATLETLSYLEKMGVIVDYLGLDKSDCGTIDFDELKEKVTAHTSLITLIDVNNETGAKLDIAKLVLMRNRYFPHVHIHLDCVQSFGKYKEKIGKMGIEFASVSAHKIHGPKGVGFLYHKSSAKLSPLIHGGGQQNHLRSGTENASLIKGLTIASIDAHQNIDLDFEKTIKLKQLMLDELNKFGLSYIINSPVESSPYILNISFPGIKAETLLHQLASLGVYVSTVSACSSKKQQISHVLDAMGTSKENALSAIRISFNRFNTKDEIVLAAKFINQAILLLLPK